MSSSYKINYSIRVNKSIERKIIAQYVGEIGNSLNLKYKYIGFGSLWFVDFIYFHKILNIHDMHSIERDEIIYHRASFSKPFACINLYHGDSTSEIEKILDSNSGPSVIWLDYDDNVFNCLSYLQDVEMIVNKAAHGTILIVTMNANNGTVRIAKGANPHDWQEKVKELLKNVFGAVDIEAVKDNQLLQEQKFIPFVSELFSETIDNQIYSSGNKKVSTKIFDFSYKDGVEMLTQGFILMDKDKAADVSKLELLKGNYFLNDAQFRISAPTLTIKERLSLDQNLPSNDIENLITSTGVSKVGDEEVLNSTLLGFPLQVESVRSYSDLYKYYPIFSEIFHS